MTKKDDAVGTIKIWCADASKMSSVLSGPVKIYSIGFMDKRPVHFISTVPTGVMTRTRFFKVGTGRNTRREQREVLTPTIVPLYNYTMGGMFPYTLSILL